MMTETHAAEASPPRILVVDDDAMLRNLLVDVLTHEGYIVDVAACGEDALARLDVQPVDLVITDVVMPGISGVDVLRNARRKFPDLDVIVMTGYASVDTAIRSIRLGAVDYITKPFNLDHIRALVGKTIELSRVRSENRSSDERSAQAGVDITTGLYNRALFLEVLDGELHSASRSSRDLSVLVIDLIESQEGAPLDSLSWDRLVTLASWSLRRTIRPGDRLGRLGPERLAIILPDLSPLDVALERDRLLSELRHSFRMQGFSVRVSMGGSTYPSGATDMTALLELAERAAHQNTATPANTHGDEV